MGPPQTQGLNATPGARGVWAPLGLAPSWYQMSMPNTQVTGHQLAPCRMVVPLRKGPLPGH